MVDTTRLRDLLVNENGFAFDPSTGFTYNISLPGLDIIKWFRDGATESDVLHRLLEEYDVEERRAARDLDAFIGSLTHYGLVLVEGEGVQ
jgi:hypothetical protein